MEKRQQEMGRRDTIQAAVQVLVLFGQPGLPILWHERRRESLPEHVHCRRTSSKKQRVVYLELAKLVEQFLHL